VIEDPDSPEASAVALESLRRWGKILASFFGTYAVVQALGLIAGLLLVNFLPVEEFALYTLAGSVLSFLIFLTDLGTTSALAHFHREDLVAGRPAERHVAAVRSLRHVALILVSAVGTIVFVVLARAENFSPKDTVLASAAILLSLVFQVEASLRLMENRLANRFGRTYRAELAGAAIRLAGAGLLIATGWLFGWVALATGAISTLLVALALGGYQRGSGYEGLQNERRAVLRYLLPTLPSALYFSIQGPLTVWLAATFGSTRNLAEVGALGRLGLIVGAVGALVGVVLVPKLSRISEERIWRRRYREFALLLLALAIPIVAVSAWAPRALLVLVGNRYEQLDAELLVVVATACLGIFDGYLVGVNNARSWTRLQAPALGLLVVAQALLAWRLPLSTTLGVVLFGFGSRVVSTACQLGIGLLGMSRPGWVRWETR
jgi:O-antigen/teichoic acid export membrane protein